MCVNPGPPVVHDIEKANLTPVAVAEAADVAAATAENTLASHCQHQGWDRGFTWFSEQLYNL